MEVLFCVAEKKREVVFLYMEVVSHLITNFQLMEKVNIENHLRKSEFL